MKYLISIFSVLLLCTSCNQSGSEVAKIVAERDSLRITNQQQSERLSAINEMVTTINTALDSISEEEGLLFIDPNSELPIKRTDALKNLDRYEKVLRHYQDKITKLQSTIKNNKGEAGVSELVEHMKLQLAQKDAQIASLREELSKKDVDIEKLQQKVLSQKILIDDQASAIAELDKKSQAQTKALVKQDEMINQCYVLIGTKKDLERKGVLKKKKLVNDAVLDRSKFAKVDIRKWREISFEAKRPRILTNMPESSYQLTTTSKRNFTLHVLNPTDFWSISNFLVIQTD